jgi:hypothetical protein
MGFSMKHTLVKSLPDKPKQNAYIDALFILSVASSIFQGVTQGIFSHDELIRANLSNHKIAVLVYFVLS